MTPTPTQIARAVETACAALGLGDQAEVAVRIAIETVTGSGRIAGLTRMQARVVRLVAAARGRIVTHADLHEACGMGGNVDTVRVHLYKVRALRPDIGRHIRTEHNMGLRWDGPALETLA